MSGERDLQELADRVEALAAELRTADLPLGEKIQRGTAALDLYRRLKALFGRGRLEVRTLYRTEEGALAEGEFDWKAMEEGAGR